MTNAAVKTMIFLRAKLVISFECVCKMLFGGYILHFAGDADGGIDFVETLWEGRVLI